MQEILTAVIVAAAVIYALVRILRRTKRGKCGCDLPCCGDCPACASYGKCTAERKNGGKRNG